MRVYDPARPLVFIHVPKTAGRSVREVFRGWFRGGLVPHYYDERTGTPPVPADLAALHRPGRPVCVFGHFNRDRGFGVEHSYPQAVQFVTILRDPFDQAVSQYYFARSREGVWQDPGRVPAAGLRSYLETVRPNMLNHFPRQVTAANFREMMERDFVEIGIMEQLEPSLRRIAGRLGRRLAPGAPGHLNATPRDAETADLQALRAGFRDRNPLEFEVYDHARAGVGLGPAPD